RHDHRADRARHGGGDGHQRPGRRARLRQEDRRRHARRGARQPRRDPRLPRSAALMGFFLETLFGGLMAGMLYSLIALGFVLIYKASGVFNFAQGAMVLFAALAMARFSEWFPLWFHFD